MTGDVIGAAGSRKVALELATSIPNLDRLVSAAAHNKAVVGREGDRKNLRSVTNKSGFGLTFDQIPKTHRLIPRAGNGVLAIAGKSNVLDKVVMAMKRLLSNSKGFAVASYFPYYRRLV